MRSRRCAERRRTPVTLRQRRSKRLRSRIRQSISSRLIPRWSTFPPMIRGWLTGIPLRLGRDGIHTLESGLEDRTSHLESASASAGGVDLDGDGVIGDSIGIITQCCLTTADTIPTAQRFITGAISIAAEWTARELSTGPGEWPGLSRGIGRRLADTQRRAVRAASARGPSAATTMVDRPGAIPRAEAPASVAAEGFTEVAGAATAAEGGGNRDSGRFLQDRRFRNGGKPHAESELEWRQISRAKCFFGRGRCLSNGVLFRFD